MSVERLEKIAALATEARALQFEGRYAEAGALLQRGLYIATAAFGPNHIETLRNEMNLAVSYRRRGDAPRALSMLEGVVAGLAKHVGDREGAYVYRLALNHFAAAFREVGRHAEAEAALEDCLAVTETELEALQEEQARAFDNLADVLIQRGELEKAEQLARRAMELWTKLGKANSLAAVASMSHLGNIHMRKGELVEARNLLGRAFRLEATLSGPDHPSVGAMLNLMGTLELLSGDLDQAETHFARSLAIGSARLLETHPQLTEAKAGLEAIHRERCERMQN